jgi:site-specific DNA recombinase
MDNKTDYKQLKFCVYARKSQTGEDDQALSIPAQLSAAREMADKLGVKPLMVFSDSQTAHKPYVRDGFQKMMQALSDGEIDSILVWKADRLARNPIDGGQISYMLQSGSLKLIQTPYNRYLPTDNILPLTIELGMANQYSIDLSRNVKRGNKEKVKGGGWCSVAPQGYLNNKLEKTVIVDEDRFHFVRKMWDLMLTGNHSLSQICKIANEEWGFKTIRHKKVGGKPLIKSTLEGMLKNPFYYGRVKSGEHSNWGNHKPMITEVEFEKVQEIMRRSGRKGATNYEFPLTGCLKCGECGCSITAEEKVKYRCPACNSVQTAKHPRKCRCGQKLTLKVIGNGTWYTYYHCTKKRGKCGQGSVTDVELEGQVVEYLNKIEVDPDFEEWAIKWCKVYDEDRRQTKKGENSKFQKAYEQAEAKLNSLIDMRADGELTKDQFLDRKEAAIQDKKHAKAILDKAEKADEDWLVAVEEELDFVIGVEKRFENGAINDKKYIFEKIGSNLLLKDKKLSLEPKRLYMAFREFYEMADTRFEPTKSNFVSAKRGTLHPRGQEWLRGPDSNRRPID